MKTTYVRVIARFVCRDVDPATLVGKTVRLYDADAVTNDFLSTATVEPGGTAGFLFDLAAARSLDSWFETKPDLFCVVTADDGRILYRSDVHRNTDFLGIDPQSGEEHRTIEIEFHEA